ncbi:glutamine--tRNA ligase/YqeY domain fusion protein [Paenibacillus protaetiae]|uniref:Glutamine--tRNA ligase n=1 Tax=Paenibacillus protaetiae TaxID=2509456 RepID=A0A4P6ETD3_9BACL|nr:glutamine--tRNA ligase/YqeY domain fusion protein [Paenibacillus protaetiae]QAY65886.1 glutamine--tRNA ligase/YqeY domain fusion protein [Paenibacillus protaetiae]
MSGISEDRENQYMLKLINDELAHMPFHREMCTRFPPEPNGYLHIGSAYAIHMSYSIASRHNGRFHLRFDDTNPLKEDWEYVNAIVEDMKWLGYEPDAVYFGSDYSDQIYRAAVALVQQGKAYLCDLTAEETAEYRGTLTMPGTNSPYRTRSVRQNVELLERMKQGEFPAGAKVLRAKIDMASPNMNLRDPVLYRIIHATHYRTGDSWCIYPMYDFAHPIQDAIEGITYSLCSVEFKDHRPLYEWVLHELGYTEPPRQREFGRLHITGAVTSKRYIRAMVDEGVVDGWDDPRLPTLKGLRRRGYTPESIRSFIREIGSIRVHSTAHLALLDHHLRQDLKTKTVGVMAVLHPLKVVITNYQAGGMELLELDNSSENRQLGTREVPFAQTIYIERDDFMEHPPAGYYRLSPGTEVRLKGAYFIRCDEVVKDPQTGEIMELRCTYDPLTRSGAGFTGRKVKGTIHWVSAAHAVRAEVRLYEPLLLENASIQGEDWRSGLNPHSLTVVKQALLEPFIHSATPENTFQFIRHGYFVLDRKDSTAEKPVFNRIVPLKDSWTKR